MTARLGKIEFSINLTNVQDENFMRDMAQTFSLINFVPINIYHVLERGVIEYVGWSSQFAALNEGEIPPLYTLEITKGDDGDIIDAKVS